MLLPQEEKLQVILLLKEEREAAYYVASKGREVAYEIIRGRRETVPEVTQAVFGERYVSFGRYYSNLLSNTSIDVDQRKIVSQHQPDIEMNDQCLQGAGIDQEERINYQILRGAGRDQEEGMNDQCLQDAGIDLATKIASSQMEEDNLLVLAHLNKFSSLLKLRRSAAWMYRIIKKTQKLTRNVSELTELNE
jgi:hypothetical protein